MEGTTVEEMVVITMEMVVITMEMVVIIMEMEASIMEEMVAGTMVTVMVVIIMEEMEDITMEVVADPTQIMEMAGTTAIIMVVQILDNKSKNINICTVKTEDSESTK